MIQAAIKVNKLQDSIDWDERKDRFWDAVWRDFGGSGGDSGDSGASSKENDNVGLGLGLGLGLVGMFPG